MPCDLQAYDRIDSWQIVAVVVPRITTAVQACAQSITWYPPSIIIIWLCLGFMVNKEQLGSLTLANV